ADQGSLAQHLGESRLPAQASAQLVAALARAVEHAHRHGVVHRDLKPANVLLLSPDEEAATHPAQMVPKIANFWLAKKLHAESGQTRSDAIVGTPSYMAPEQAAGKVHEIGPACDVYALGAILYECLTGQPPFEGPTALDVVLKVISEAPRPPRAVRSNVPKDL